MCLFLPRDFKSITFDLILLPAYEYSGGDFFIRESKARIEDKVKIGAGVKISNRATISYDIIQRHQLSQIKKKKRKDHLLALLTKRYVWETTITSDNGKELAKHKTIATKLKAKFYFVRPYRAWERGLNENTNRLVRQYFPKGTDFTTITQKDIKICTFPLNIREVKTKIY